MKKLLFTFVIALLTGTAWASGGNSVGTVTHLSGTFSVKRTDGTTKVLAVNSDVFEGDLLTTEAETYARIRFSDGSEVVLRPETQFKIEKFAFKEDDASGDNAFFSLLKGGLRAASGLIGKRSREKVSYGTAVATIGIRGTNWGALFCQNDCGGIPTTNGTSPANGLHIDVANGAIVVSNAGGTQNYAAGQFGYVASIQFPPIIVPPAQGFQVTMPPSISANAAHGQSPAGGSGAVNCEVR